MIKEDNELFEKLDKAYDSLFEEEDSDVGLDDFHGLFDAPDLDDFNEDLDNIIVLNDEAGSEHKFEFLDLIEYKGEEYVILLPTEDDDDEVVILRLEESDSDDEESYVSIDDESTLNAVFAVFKEKFKNEFNFTD